MEQFIKKPYAHLDMKIPEMKVETPTYSIYQIKNSRKFLPLRFTSFDLLKSGGGKIEKENYDLVYTAIDQNNSLDEIYNKFNCDLPDDFFGHSLSISDIITIEKDGQQSAHYVDTFGFKSVPEFFGRNAENSIKKKKPEMEM